MDLHALGTEDELLHWDDETACKWFQGSRDAGGAGPSAVHQASSRIGKRGPGVHVGNVYYRWTINIFAAEMELGPI